MEKQQFTQLVRYIFVGAISNAAGYITYLLLTYFGLTPSIAMTLLYITIAGISFFGNKKLTFMYDGHLLGAGIRYLIAHFIGYSINLAILLYFSEHLGYSHALVQAGAILTVAIYLFITLKLFVFRRAA
ncbi:hypothetical protein BJN42_20670 [Pseudomonas koreensis]|jgi:putative flippase GtrA|uniref:GtrA family protein n=1 Tax=Pseudomonas iranensis TaxID=2745503 RepID=A0AAU7ESB1_9PSED|nr:GtrA family protein [Pseudomonas sp. GXM4]KAB2519009.1 GtrA family protein [Pseudomonas sp. GXM4]OFJ43614.1 hypothetical protein BJN42_20670 [Pseudomonas koreensis]CAH0218192.1 hypothetical protein SRABI89_02166 [Pseudomonas koreensis]